MLKQFVSKAMFAKAPAKQKALAKIAVYNTKKYDKDYFEKLNTHMPAGHQLDLNFFTEALNERTANLAQDCDGVCIFVNDHANANVVKKLNSIGVNLIALRCAGFNNVDIKQSQESGMKVVRVPAYSPEAVAEHAMALLLTLNRKVHKAYNRTREGNFNLDGLLGFNLHGKTVGIVGTGKIGAAFAAICKGFGMKILCYDVHENEQLVKDYGVQYVDLDTMFRVCDILSLHCPLTTQTKHLINEQSISIMKPNVTIINTGRGALIETKAAISGLKRQKIAGLALDVYEQEEALFFKDVSANIMTDDLMARLLSFNNVIVTGHQAFFTQEAITNICQTTINNIVDIKTTGKCINEVVL